MLACAVPANAADDNSAYQTHQTAEAAAIGGVNIISDKSISGEYGNDKRNEYSYAIFNSLDFGNTKDDIYAQIEYTNAYTRQGTVNIISLGDYVYQDGDTISFNGDVPTVTRGGKTVATGTMLKQGYNPAAVTVDGSDGSTWNTKYTAKFNINYTTGTQTIMISVKDYCRIWSVTFSHEVRDAYKDRAVTSAAVSVNQDDASKNNGFSGAPNNGTVYGYAIFNGLNFGENTDDVWAEMTYTHGYTQGVVALYDFGADYTYQDGDVVEVGENSAKITRGEQTFTGTKLSAKAPEITGKEVYGGTPSTFSMHTGKLSGTHTILASSCRFVYVTNIKFTKTAPTAVSVNGNLTAKTAIGGNFSGILTIEGCEMPMQLVRDTSAEWYVDFGTTGKYYDVSMRAAVNSAGSYDVYVDGTKCVTFTGTENKHNMVTLTGSIGKTLSGEHTVKIVSNSADSWFDYITFTENTEAMSAYKYRSVSEAVARNAYNAGTGWVDNGNGDAYAIFEGLDFGSDNTETYANIKYVCDMSRTNYIMYDLGDYTYAEGDTIAAAGGVLTVTKADGTAVTATEIVRQKPQYSEIWTAANAKTLTRPVTAMNGTHTIAVTVSGAGSVMGISFAKTAPEIGAYSDTLDMNNYYSTTGYITFEDTSAVKNYTENPETTYAKGGRVFFGDLGPSENENKQVNEITWKNVNFGDTAKNVAIDFEIGVSVKYADRPIIVCIDGEEVGRHMITPTSTEDWWVDFRTQTTALLGTISGTHTVTLKFPVIGTGSLVGVTFRESEIAVTKDGTGVTIANNTTASGTVINALYKDGELADIAIGNAAITLPTAEEGADYVIKSFLWDSVEGMKPMRNAVTYNPGIDL